ncbi:unnamed protein product [Lupinus luteus]|uniref:NADH:quinone oxidoreductase/Mrp antiporter membrane subunit domain-containing protein n=1 Tax=Lupinus luteus TaxID=3873 RepID=A0AAV1XMJ7_LUPLU
MVGLPLSFFCGDESCMHKSSPLAGIGSLSDTGLNGAILQIISHGFIGAALFFLAGTGYDRLRLLYLDEMGGMAIPCHCSHIICGLADFS